MIGSLLVGVLFRRNLNSPVWWLSILAFVVALGACGGGSSGDDGLTIVSPNGKATLVIQEGSLPDDVSIDDIQVDWAQGLSDEAGAPLFSVRLSPSGLSLSEAAVLQVEIPDTVEQLLAVHSNADGFEIVETAVEPAGDSLVATIEIEHFSWLTLYSLDGLRVEAEATPASVEVGQIQDVAMEVQIRDGTIALWINVGAWDEDIFQQFEFRIQSIATGPFPLNASWWNGTELSEEWDPGRAIAQVREDELFVEMSAASMCVEPNTAVPQFKARLILGMRLVSKGPVVEGSNLALLEAFGTTVNVAEVPEVSGLLAPRFVPFTMRVDERILGAITVTRRLSSECVAAPGSNDTTSTSSTIPPTSSTSSPPAEEGTSALNLVGSAGNVTCEDPNNTLDPALTITGAQFVQDGDEIVVTIMFEGDAEAYEQATTDSFPFAVQFRLKEDTSGYPEVFFGEKGKLKVSGGLLQVVSHEFSGNKLTIRVKGRTLDDVKGVQVSTFVFAGGSCQDLLFSDGYND